MLLICNYTQWWQGECPGEEVEAWNILRAPAIRPVEVILSKKDARILTYSKQYCYCKKIGQRFLLFSLWLALRAYGLLPGTTAGPAGWTPYRLLRSSSKSTFSQDRGREDIQYVLYKIHIKFFFNNHYFQVIYTLKNICIFFFLKII